MADKILYKLNPPVIDIRTSCANNSKIFHAYYVYTYAVFPRSTQNYSNFFFSSCIFFFSFFGNNFFYYYLLFNYSGIEYFDVNEIETLRESFFLFVAFLKIGII